MIEMIKREWLLFFKRVYYFIPVLSISLILLYPEGDRGYFIIGLPLTLVMSILLFVQDDRKDNVHQLINLPLSRAEIASGKYFAAWSLMLANMFYLVMLGFFLGLFSPDALPGFMSFLRPPMFFTYLWVLTLLTIPIFPVLYFFLGRGLQALVLLGLGFNALFGVLVLVQYNRSGASFFDLLAHWSHAIYTFHTEPFQYLISILGLGLLNFGILYVCRWIFIRKEF